MARRFCTDSELRRRRRRRWRQKSFSRALVELAGVSAAANHKQCARILSHKVSVRFSSNLCAHLNCFARPHESENDDDDEKAAQADKKVSANEPNCEPMRSPFGARILRPTNGTQSGKLCAALASASASKLCAGTHKLHSIAIAAAALTFINKLSTFGPSVRSRSLQLRPLNVQRSAFSVEPDEPANSLAIRRQSSPNQIAMPLRAPPNWHKSKRESNCESNCETSESKTQAKGKTSKASAKNSLLPYFSAPSLS